MPEDPPIDPTEPAPEPTPEPTDPGPLPEPEPEEWYATAYRVPGPVDPDDPAAVAYVPDWTRAVGPHPSRDAAAAALMTALPSPPVDGFAHATARRVESEADIEIAMIGGRFRDALEEYAWQVARNYPDATTGQALALRDRLTGVLDAGLATISEGMTVLAREWADEHGLTSPVVEWIDVEEHEISAPTPVEN